MTRPQTPTSDLATKQGGATPRPVARTSSYVPPLVAPPPEPHLAPTRPPLAQKAPAPVLVKVPPPLSVRLVQLAWVISLIGGAASIVYAFVIRLQQLPAIEKLAKSVQPGRAHATYESAAQILFWCVFGGMIVVVLAQIALFVSFGNRRSNVRWWLFATLFLQGVVLIFAHEFLAFGDRGRPLELLLAGQYAFVILALLLSLLPPALRWSARRYDIRRGDA
jgi:hypothetical protein